MFSIRMLNSHIRFVWLWRPSQLKWTICLRLWISLPVKQTAQHQASLIQTQHRIHQQLVDFRLKFWLQSPKLMKDEPKKEKDKKDSQILIRVHRIGFNWKKKPWRHWCLFDLPDDKMRLRVRHSSNL